MFTIGSLYISGVAIILWGHVVKIRSFRYPQLTRTLLRLCAVFLVSLGIMLELFATLLQCDDASLGAVLIIAATMLGTLHIGSETLEAFRPGKAGFASIGTAIHRMLEAGLLAIIALASQIAAAPA